MAIADGTASTDAGATPMTRQLPLALPRLPERCFETFVGAPAGMLEHLRTLATGISADSVLLVGPGGIGKTHLALSVVALARQRGRNTFYLELAAAPVDLPTALEGAQTCSLVVLDGLEAVAGAGEAETALFDLHNRVRDAGGTLLYTASAGPDALLLSLPDLRSRLSQCARLAPQPLSDVQRAQALRLRAARRGLAIDDAAIDWLLRHSGRRLSELTDILDRLDTASLAAQRRVTVPFLRQVLTARGG